MRKSNFICQVKFCLLSFLLPAVIFSCKKNDENNSNSGSLVNYRLSEWIAYENYVEDEKGVVEYSGDKIQQIIAYDYQEKGNWIEDWKYVIQYPDQNTSIVLYYHMDNNTWLESHKEAFIFQNGNISEYVYYLYNGSYWEPQERETYAYSNYILQQVVYYNYDNNTWVESYKYIFEYNNTQLQQLFVYCYINANWEIENKEVYEYNGALLERIFGLGYISNKNGWDSSYMTRLEYTGNKIINAISYNYENSSWILDLKINFYYDINGNVSSRDYFFYSSGTSWKTEFTYEAGIGNLKQLFYSRYGLFNTWSPLPTKGHKQVIQFIRKFGMHHD